MNLNPRTLLKLETITDSTEVLLSVFGKEKLYKGSIKALKDYIAPSTGTTIIVDITPEQLEAMGASKIILLPELVGEQYYDYEIILELTIDGLIDTNSKTVAIIGEGSFSGTKLESLESYISFGSTVFRASSYSKNTETNEGSIQTNEAVVLTNYEGGEWTTAGTTSGRAIIKYRIRTFGE